MLFPEEIDALARVSSRTGRSFARAFFSARTGPEGSAPLLFRKSRSACTQSCSRLPGNTSAFPLLKLQRPCRHAKWSTRPERPHSSTAFSTTDMNAISARTSSGNSRMVLSMAIVHQQQLVYIHVYYTKLTFFRKGNLRGWDLRVLKRGSRNPSRAGLNRRALAERYYCVKESLQLRALPGRNT